MFETARFEARQQLPGAVALAIGISVFAGMMIAIAPGILAEVDLEALTAQLPPQMVAAFSLSVIGTIEGFIALELYEFVWLLGLGIYVAYQGAGDIADDIEAGRMDMVLSAPVSRGQVVLEKFLALWTPMLVVNAVVFAVVFAGTRLIDDPIAVTDLLAVHALSIPYLLCCGALGVFASVAAPRRVVAEGAAVGILVGTFLIEAVTIGTDAEWLASGAPMQYYDPVAILTASEYDLWGAGILLAGTAVLLLASRQWFERRDI